MGLHFPQLRKLQELYIYIYAYISWCKQVKTEVYCRCSPIFLEVKPGSCLSQSGLKEIAQEASIFGFLKISLPSIRIHLLNDIECSLISHYKNYSPMIFPLNHHQIHVFPYFFSWATPSGRPNGSSSPPSTAERSPRDRLDGVLGAGAGGRKGRKRLAVGMVLDLWIYHVILYIQYIYIYVYVYVYAYNYIYICNKRFNG